jgi:uncharacterized membrane protein YcjF (UPF0283 family)
MLLLITVGIVLSKGVIRWGREKRKDKIINDSCQKREWLYIFSVHVIACLVVILFLGVFF